MIAIVAAHALGNVTQPGIGQFGGVEVVITVGFIFDIPGEDGWMLGKGKKPYSYDTSTRKEIIKGTDG